jgi:endonuclease YncB( thermonuclease family)
MESQEPLKLHTLRTITRWLNGVALLLCAMSALAAEFTGHVISVADGHTITVADGRSQHLRIRLAGIHAPARGQPYARQSAENLGRLLRRRDVLVRWHGKDRYGRRLGVVFYRGQDMNLEQLRAGYAWWHREYAEEQSPQERVAYERAECDAREKKRGLWSEPDPVPPWDWRQAPGRNAGMVPRH